MRVAFYAPMKPPDHPVPSGDRRMARLLMEALRMAGHEAELACHLVTRDRQGDPARQTHMIALGRSMAQRLARRFEARPAAERPAVWLTYHAYYKAPDLLGPQVAERLRIPYLAAEVSLARKREGGPWDAYHKALTAALERAAAVITLNPADAPALPRTLKQVTLLPFLEAEAFHANRAASRARLARQQDLPLDEPWLLAVGMFRRGDKLASYRLLGDALTRLQDRPWRLLLAGAGPARAEVEAALAPLDARRLHWLGELGAEALKSCYAGADLMVWPAIREAYGMALLEAQAAGLPVVAGREGGVPAVVADGESGLLTPPGDAQAFAGALVKLLDDPARRTAMGRAAQRRVTESHDIAAASARLDALLREVVAP